MCPIATVGRQSVERLDESIRCRPDQTRVVVVATDAVDNRGAGPHGGPGPFDVLGVLAARAVGGVGRRHPGHRSAHAGVAHLGDRVDQQGIGVAVPPEDRRVDATVDQLLRHRRLQGSQPCV